MPNTNDLTYSSRPPSPIPTGKGVRSAGNQAFSDFLDNSGHVPELTRSTIFMKIQYQSLVSGYPDSIQGVLESAKAYGVFGIVGLGVSAEELRLLKDEADLVIGGHTNFGKENNNVWSKLITVAEELVKALLRNADEDLSEKLEGRTLTARIQQRDDEKKSLSKEIKSEQWNHVLSFILPLEQCRLQFCSDMSIHAGPDIVIATIGPQLEEWSRGKVRYVASEPICDEKLPGTLDYILIEIKYSDSCPNDDDDDDDTNSNRNIISVRDQLLMALILAFLYKVWQFISW